MVTNLCGGVPSRRAVLALGLIALGIGAKPSAAPSVGRIEGYVRLTAGSVRPVLSGVYPSRRVSAPAAHATPEMNNVVVFIKNAPARERVSPMKATIAQKDESFVPRVIAITAGSTVEFPNFDPYFHNVFSLSRAASFDLGRFPRGDSRTRKFTTSGLVKVYCQIHSHMSASILVFDHDYFQIPNASGAFALDEVPAGTYQISAWHERIGESVRQVRVEPGQRTRVEFSLPVNDR
ncbi:MAG: carboxypeptidase regulatory-like domain-containing protein [Vicinamibacterales bacterium]